MDLQIELFSHWKCVTEIQDFDSRLVKTGLVIGDTQSMASGWQFASTRGLMFFADAQSADP